MVVDSGHDGSNGDSGGDSGDGASMPGEGGRDGAIDGGGRDAGPPEDGSPPSASVCDPMNQWSLVTRVPSIAATGFDHFGSVSANGDTVAWMTDAGLIFVADRASASAAFGAPTQVDVGTTPVQTGRVALDPLGLEVVATAAVAGGGSTLVAFVRSAVGGAWSLDQSGQFQFITAVEGTAVFSNPVLSLDAQSLFYLVQLGGNPPLLVESPWDDATKAWATGVDLPNPQFAMTSASQLRRPTGASSDRQTLFFYDEVVGHERTAWRNAPAEPFDYFAEVPSVPEAVPSETCGIVFFHGMDGGGQGLFTAQ
jgi:hypothetical protein